MELEPREGAKEGGGGGTGNNLHICSLCLPCLSQHPPAQNKGAAGKSKIEKKNENSLRGHDFWQTLLQVHNLWVGEGSEKKKLPEWEGVCSVVQ